VDEDDMPAHANELQGVVLVVVVGGGSGGGGLST